MPQKKKKKSSGRKGSFGTKCADDEIKYHGKKHV